MTAIQGTNVAAPLAPFDTADTHPTHDAKYGKGGWRSAATIAERDAIPAQRRTRGMIVRVTDDPTPANNGEWEWDGAAWVVAPLRQRVSDLEGRADTAEADIADLDGRATALEGQAAEAAAGIGALEGRAAALEDRTATAEGDIDALEGRATTLESRATAAESDISALEGRATEAEADISALDGRTTAAEADVDTLEGRATALEGRATAAEADIDALEARTPSIPSVLADSVPVVFTNSGQVALWLEGGDLAARGMSPQLRAQAVIDVITKSAATAEFVPLFHDAVGQVALWLEDGKLNAVGVAASLIERIRAGLSLDDALSQTVADAQQYSDAELNKRISVADASADFLPLAVSALTGQIATWLKDGLFDAKGVTPEFKSKVVGDFISTVDAAGLLPLVIAGMHVPVWLDNGALDAADMAPGLRRRAVVDIVSQVFAEPSEIIPLCFALDKIALWLDGGLLGAKGLTPQLISAIAGDVAPNFAPRNTPAAAQLPIATDGRSLYKYRAKMARLQRAQSGAKVRIGFTGDSWTDGNTIPWELRAYLETSFSNAGEGWQSVELDTKMNGVTLARSGWTYIDGENSDVSAHPTGIDGKSIYATDAAATLALGNVTATDVTIYYSNSTVGVFRYAIDGGAWTTVTSTGDGSLGTVVLSGLADTTHTVNIDTVGNSGTIYILGFFTTRAVSGVEITKQGNAGQRGKWMRTWIPNIPDIAATIDIDILVVFLGTNDYRTPGCTVSEFVSALTELADAYKSAVPDIGFIFVAPPDSDGVAVVPLVEYRDAMYRFCIQNGYEFCNLHDIFGTYEQMQPLDVWGNALHLNSNGARIWVDEAINKFLHV